MPSAQYSHRSISLFALLLIILTVAANPAFSQESDDSAELRDQLALAQRLLGKTPDRAAILYFLAGTHALLHEPHEAIANLKECVAAKEGFDPVGDRVFAGLGTSADFQRLTEQVHKDFPEVTQARVAFMTREKDLVPEGIAYDSVQDAFYLSSLHLKKILRIPRQNPEKISDFIPGDRDNLLPVLGIRMDPSDGSIWSASWLDNGRTELLHFDNSGSLLGRFSVSQDNKHGFNDLVVLRNGNVFVTDTAGNQVYRFEPKSKTFQNVKLNRELLMPNGIALSDDERYLYVADQFGVLRFDFKTGESAELDPGPHSTLAGADGLYWHKGSLIAIQNGIGSPRIADFQLSSDGLHVSKTVILENRSPFTVLPTTGAFRGDEFYFIVNSQLDNLNGDRVLDITKLQPVRIGVLTLP